VAGPENQTSRSLYALVTGPTDLKESLVLPLQLDFAIVQTSR
jgi:hypothetical protein